MRYLTLLLLLSNIIFSQNNHFKLDKIESQEKTNESDVKIVSEGPIRVVELIVEDVAQDYNNSKSTPIASHGNYVYWTYVATDDPENPSEYYIQLHQIEIPDERIEGPYSIRESYDFVNNASENDHELLVRNSVISGGVLTSDELHSAPSVGVDKEGFIHIIGGMHHSQEWEYCVSKEPNDITSFNCVNKGLGTENLPPYSRATYPQFFKHNDGSLYLTYRARFSSDWHPGTSFSVLAKYNEEIKEWRALGDIKYRVGDFLDQGSENFITNEITNVHELGLTDNWETKRPDPLIAHFYSDTGIYHRYYREPQTGEKLPVDDNVTGYAYQAFWPDMKIGVNNRMHFCVMVFNKPDWSLAAQNEEEGADINKEYSVTNPNGEVYIYTEQEYINNYTIGATILYAYSDDGGETFFAPNGVELDTPITPHAILESNGGSARVNATVENGGIVIQDHSSELNTNIWTNTRLAILPDGRPIIHFTERLSDDSGNNEFNSMIWDGEKWVESSSTRDSGAGGGMVSDANGGLWLFESHQVTENGGAIPEKITSAGSTILYSENGIEGPWEQILSKWENGNRIDTYQANTSNVLRYVEMNIQNGGTAKLISLRSPNGALSLEDNYFSSTLNLYPNPSSNRVSISSNGTVLNAIKVYDILGKEVYNSGSETDFVDVSSFAKGVYFFRIEAEDKIAIKRILVN